jgi:hypothetical protein
LEKTGEAAKDGKIPQFGKTEKKLIEARPANPARPKMKNKQPKLAPPYAAETKDVRLAGTFEVLVPVPDRNKPHKVPLQFASLKEAEAWLHSSEGKDMVQDILEDARKGK